MSAYYNENAEFPATWLEQLVERRHIAPGNVDRRSIREVRPDDVVAVQAHFFAGIGGWPYALRLAGWPDDLPVWTGSCPCQPFSTAGRKGGFDDERHLWPEWFRLIRECCPAVIFGEQVASPDGRAWLDLVSTDLEGAGYAVGAANLCAAGIGAPHIRQRLFWVAYAGEQRRQGLRPQLQPRRPQQAGVEAARSGTSCILADSTGEGRRWPGGASRAELPAEEPGELGRPGATSGLADSARSERARRDDVEARTRRSTVARRSAAGGLGDSDGDAARQYARDDAQGRAEHAQRSADGDYDPERAGATGGAWADAEWIACRDGVYRPAQPGAFPLVTGFPNRVELQRALGQLRGYGNAVVPQLAATFIEAAVAAIGEAHG